MTNPVSGQADDPADGFIPGAIKFDLDGEGSDHNSSLPHTLPEQAALSALFGKLGITTDKPVLIYDNWHVLCAPGVVDANGDGPQKCRSVKWWSTGLENRWS